jgi:parallel beta-helix repeat protein
VDATGHLAFAKIKGSDLSGHLDDTSKHLVENGTLSIINKTPSTENIEKIVIGDSNGRLKFSSDSISVFAKTQYVNDNFPKLENELIPVKYLPSYVDDVIEGKLSGGKFYKYIISSNVISDEIPGETGKIYVDITNNTQYRWSGTQFTKIADVLGLENHIAESTKNISTLSSNVDNLTTVSNSHALKSDLNVVSGVVNTNKTNISTLSSKVDNHLKDTSKHLVANGYLNSLNQVAAATTAGNIVVAGPNGQLDFTGWKDSDLSTFNKDISALKQKFDTADTPTIFGDNFISILDLIPNGNNGTTDVTSEVNTALTTLNGLGGGTLFFPPGTYWFSDSSYIGNNTNLIEIPSNISIMGAGKQTILRFDTTDTKDKLNSNGACFLHLATNASNILFSNLTIRGGLFKDGYYSKNATELSSKEPWKDKDLNSYLNVPTTNTTKFDGNNWIVPGKRTAHAIGGSNISNITFDNVTFESCRYMAVTLTECKNVKVVNCTLSHILRDGIHLKNCKNSIISNNHFYRVLDDAIAIHTMDDSLAEPAPIGWGTPGLTNVKRNTTYHC